MTEAQRILEDEARLQFRLQALRALVRIRKARLRRALARRSAAKPIKLGPNLWADLQSEMSRCQEQLRALRLAKRRKKREVSKKA